VVEDGVVLIMCGVVVYVLDWDDDCVIGKYNLNLVEKGGKEIVV
jgi:hypothetical protein